MLISNTAFIVLSSSRWLRRVPCTWESDDYGDREPSARAVTLFCANGWPNIEHYDAELMIALMEEEMGVTDATSICRNDLTNEPLSVEERKARAAAVRGLVNARDGRFDKARTLFGEALSFDPSLDLTQIPTFWKLPRGGQDAAVGAYQDAGMQKEAKILSSNLNYHFRPKLVRRRPRLTALPNT